MSADGAPDVGQIPEELGTAPATSPSKARGGAAGADEPSGSPELLFDEEEADHGAVADAPFTAQLRYFFAQRGGKLHVPRFVRKPLDLERFWNAVAMRGGYDEVTQAKKWAEVGRTFNPPSSMTNLSFHVRNLYERTLLAYERHLQGIEVPLRPFSSSGRKRPLLVAEGGGGGAGATLASAKRVRPHAHPTHGSQSEEGRATPHEVGEEAAGWAAGGLAPTSQAARAVAAALAAVEQQDRGAAGAEEQGVTPLLPRPLPAAAPAAGGGPGGQPPVGFLPAASVTRSGTVPAREGRKREEEVTSPFMTDLSAAQQLAELAGGTLAAGSAAATLPSRPAGAAAAVGSAPFDASTAPPLHSAFHPWLGRATAPSTAGKGTKQQQQKQQQQQQQQKQKRRASPSPRSTESPPTIATALAELGQPGPALQHVVPPAAAAAPGGAASSLPAGEGVSADVAAGLQQLASLISALQGELQSSKEETEALRGQLAAAEARAALAEAAAASCEEQARSVLRLLLPGLPLASSAVGPGSVQAPGPGPAQMPAPASGQAPLPEQAAALAALRNAASMMMPHLMGSTALGSAPPAFPAAPLHPLPPHPQQQLPWQY